MPFLAAIEVDQRQTIISASDKLKEMMGGSYNIAGTVREITETLAASPNTRLVMPVSGATWLTSSDFSELSRILWKCRGKIVEDLDLPCTFAIVSYHDFDQGKKELEAKVRRIKNSKSAEDGTFSSPLAACCQIQPNKHANHWFPKRLKDDQWERRALVSASSLQRQKRGHKPMSEFLDFPEAEKWDPPNQLADLIASSQDQFIALIKADGDGMTQLTSTLTWSGLAEELGRGDKTIWQSELDDPQLQYGPVSRIASDRPSAEQALAIFSNRVEKIQQEALKRAVHHAVGGMDGNKKPFPVVPIIRAGEDTAILCRRDLALPVALTFAEEYGQLAAADGIFNSALRAAKLEDTVALSLSIGILFAKQGYPFEMMWELGEELLHEAKNARARTNSGDGFMDFFWFASSGRSEIRDIRDQSQRNTERSLITRPWSLKQARIQMALASDLGQAAIPPGKWAQLDTVLHAPPEFSELAFQRWLLHLSQEQRQAVQRALEQSAKNLGLAQAAGPWLHYGSGLTTPLLEFTEILKTTQGAEVIQDVTS